MSATQPAHDQQPDRRPDARQSGGDHGIAAARRDRGRPAATSRSTSGRPTSRSCRCSRRSMTPPMPIPKRRPRQRSIRPPRTRLRGRRPGGTQAAEGDLAAAREPTRTARSDCRSTPARQLWHRTERRERRPARGCDRRGPVGAVQQLVHPVRPVLRSRSRPGQQGRQRHGVHPAAARRSALRRRAAHTNFMVLTRATTAPGADGVFGTADDVRPLNTTTPFVDQNQTYSSHPSHQVFLREYVHDRQRPGRDRSSDRGRQWRHGELG